MKKSTTPMHTRTFDSITQASALMGIPYDTLRLAKAEGCPCFRLGSRVKEAGLRAWLRRHASRLGNPPLTLAEERARIRESQRRSEELYRSLGLKCLPLT